MKYIVFVIILFSVILLNGQNTVLWEVKKEHNEKVSYLMGTHHIMGGHFVDSLYPTIKEKLLQSEIAIFEAIGENTTRKEIYKRQDNFQYKKTLKKKYTKRLEQIAKRKEYPLSKFSPTEVLWLLGKLMVQERCDNYLPSDSLLQLDDYLALVAKENSIEIQGLETYSSQLNNINKDEQNIDWFTVRNDKSYLQKLRYFIDVNHGLENTQDICAFSENYKTLAINYHFEKPCPDDVLIKERNNNWMEQLPNYLTQQNCFIAVGLTHLYYDCGLLEQLKANGFSITRIPLK